MAGAKSGEGFDHSRTGFPLSGRHASAACNQCHSGEKRVTRECESCHQDPHQSRLNRRCSSCHSSRRWNDMGAFELHRRTRFPLTGMHAIAACTECHLRNNERQWTTVQSDCFSCHASDYLDPNVHPSHRGTATSPPFPQDCSQCHVASAWSSRVHRSLPALPSAGRRGGQREARGDDRHPGRPRSGHFPVTRGPHRGAPCNSCHTSSRAPRLVRCTGVPRPQPRQAPDPARAPGVRQRRRLPRMSSRGDRPMKRWPPARLGAARPVRVPRTVREPRPARSVTVEVVDVAGGRAYLRPGEAAGVGVGSVVTVRDRRYRVVGATGQAHRHRDEGARAPRRNDAGGRARSRPRPRQPRAPAAPSP